MLKAKIKGIGKMKMLVDSDDVLVFPMRVNKQEKITALSHKFYKDESCTVTTLSSTDDHLTYSFKILNKQSWSDFKNYGCCMVLKIERIPTVVGDESLLHTSKLCLNYLMNMPKLTENSNSRFINKTKLQTFEHTGWMDDAQFSNMVDSLIDKGFSVDSKEIEVEECLISDMLKYHIKATK